MTTDRGSFVQLGATRDGLDRYLACAHRRGMRAVLVEAPAYLRWRRRLRRQPFDLEIETPSPEDPAQVAAALRTAGITPALVLAGFERYAAAAFRLAADLRVAPWPRVGAGFVPPDKARMRAVLTSHAPGVLQPRHVHLPLDTGDTPPEVFRGLPFPQVVKPVDGAGGLGVHLVRDGAERERALRATADSANYGGAAFTGLLVEEYARGTEYSLQGLARDSKARLLSFCEKVVLPEQGPDGSPPGFREAGHLAAPGADAPQALQAMAQSCVTAVGYREGPFHIDLIQTARGPLFLEMGFRLSGFGLAALVERATGLDWAELSFAAHLGEPETWPCEGHRPAAGQLVATDPGQLARARALAARHPGVRVEPAPEPPEAGGIPAADLAVLASDRERHATIVGRVTVQDGDPRVVRDRLLHCASGGRDG